MKEHYDYDVIAVCFNVSQDDDFAAIEKKAYDTGAIKTYVLDIRREFITGYIGLLKVAPSTKRLSSRHSMARPLMAKLVEIAETEGAYYIAHGCTGKAMIRFALKPLSKP